MSGIIKWWKDNTFLAVVAIVIVAVVSACVMARCFDWGWIVSMLIGVAVGLLIRRLIVDKTKGGL